MTTGDVRKNFLCSSCYEELVTLQREYEIMRMDPQDLEDLATCINMSKPEDPPIPMNSTAASSSTQPPADNQQEALLQGMVGTPEEHIMALRMATTQMLQESTPERVEEIANIFRRRPLITDKRVAAIARQGYPKPEMPLNGPLPREHYGEPPRTQEEAHNIGKAVRKRVQEEINQARREGRENAYLSGHISDAD